MRGKYPEIFNDKEKGKEAKKLFDDANLLLDEIIKNKSLQANGVIGIFPANSIKDDIIEIYSDESNKKIKASISTLRQQKIKEKIDTYFSLSDYIAGKESGQKDYIGFFANTAGMGLDKLTAGFEKNNDPYSAIMAGILADRLAEAFAELLHKKVRTEIWGYSQAEKLTIEEILLSKYKGIRPAPGYPACPDHKDKKIIFDLLDVEKNTGILLTETYMMNPGPSVCGYYFAHPESFYFSVGKITKEQAEDYAKRKSEDIKTIEKRLGSILSY